MKIETYRDEYNRLVLLPTVLYMETDIGLHMPIAIHVTLVEKLHKAWWEDTIRGHSIHFLSYEIRDKKVTITDRNGHHWYFMPLTLALFNEKALPYLTPLERPFTTENELQSYYVNQMTEPK